MIFAESIDLVSDLLDAGVYSFADGAIDNQQALDFGVLDFCCTASISG
ncbi:MAG: hypothetical protein F6K28_43525 [Microcoleus sp. SIO2G3]|nr:hypothetical protein [Microcoleus sp. SIO2G3]